jgi:hypothetical protein
LELGLELADGLLGDNLGELGTVKVRPGELGVVLVVAEGNRVGHAARGVVTCAPSRIGEDGIGERDFLEADVCSGAVGLGGFVCEGLSLRSSDGWSGLPGWLLRAALR